MKHLNLIAGPWIAAACALTALALYAATVAPTISWGDSADLAMRLVYDGDPSFIGTHRDYALWRWLGQVLRWLPIQDAGLRANLFASFWGAVTVGAVAGLVYAVTKSGYAAVVSGVALTVAHSFWLLSVIAEVYTFNAAVVFSAFYCIALWWTTERRIWIWLTAPLIGLSIAHHATGVVMLVSILPLLLARPARVGLFAGAGALGVVLIVSWPYWSNALTHLSAGKPLLQSLGLSMSQNANFKPNPVREAIMFGGYLAYNFVGLSSLLGIVGAIQAIRRKCWPVLPPLVWAAAFVYAGLTSSIPDKFNVYVLVYPSFAILCGLGAAWAIDKYQPGRRGVAIAIALTALVPPISYAATVQVMTAAGIDLVKARKAPLRDNSRYFLWPPKNGDFAPRRFAEAALADAPANAIIIADYTLWRPIYFVQAVEHVRPDVRLFFVERLIPQGVDRWITSQGCTARIFLATDTPAGYYQLDRIEQRFQVGSYRSLFEVSGQCKAAR